MNSKERVLAALNHREPDAVPVDFGSTAVTGIHVNAIAGLREHYGLEKVPIKVYEPYQMLGLLDEDLKTIMGIDVEGVPAPETLFGFRNENWKPFRLDSGLEVVVSEHFKTTRDTHGDMLIYPKGDTSAPPSGRMPKDGFFFDTIVRQEPIDEARLDPADNLEEFGPVSELDLDYFAAESDHASRTGRAVMATFGGTAFGDIALVPDPFLKHPKGIRDVEEWYISTATRQDYVHRVFEKQAEIALKNLARIKDVVGDRVDAVFVCGTDLGTQQSQFCSIETFRKLYFPYYKMVNDWIRKNATWKTFKHSCGAVESFMSRFIAAGFDIINPVQINAEGMDPVHLKKTYGKELVFWGGGIDTQKTLPYASPEKVREEVLRLCDIFAEDGGFVFNTVHNIQANVPVENIVAMIDAVKEFNGM